MKKKKSGVLMEFIPYVIVVIVVLMIKAFIVTPIRVNGSSMNDTLKNNDIMILDEISYKFSGIERFDIVVIKNDDDFLIKRVIGLPGEEIEYKDNFLYVNGKKVKENFSHAKTEDIEKIKIPKNEYYVLGDNRVNSTDSRIIGTVSIDKFLGTTKFTIFPFNRFGSKE